mgnify:CR=1 FL=1
MTFETLLWRRDGAVVHLTFNRPDRRNAVTHAMMRELTAAFAAVAADRSVRVLALRGKGGHFCAGGDLAHMLAPPEEAGPDPTASAYRRMGEALAALDALPQAVVAVVEGACVGAGLGMASTADYVIATETAKFGMPEARAGFIPSQILPAVVRRIGEGHALRLGVAARVVDGRAAADMGAVHELVADGRAADAALARLLADLAWAEPTAVAEIKRLIRRIRTDGEGAVLDDAATALSRLLKAPAAAEGIRAFQEKRPPKWAE